MGRRKALLRVNIKGMKSVSLGDNKREEKVSWAIPEGQQRSNSEGDVYMERRKAPQMVNIKAKKSVS